MTGIIFVSEGCKKCEWLKRRVLLPDGVRFYNIAEEHTRAEALAAAEALAEVMETGKYKALIFPTGVFWGERECKVVVGALPIKQYLQACGASSSPRPGQAKQDSSCEKQNGSASEGSS